MYLNHFQLRSARCVLDLGVREIAVLIGTNRTTISAIENNVIHLQDLQLAERRNNILIEFFKQNNIYFSNNYSISLNSPSLAENNKNNTLTRFQLKAARAIINESRSVFNSSIKLNRGIIEYAETFANEEYIKPKDPSVILTIINKFKQHGVIFPNNFSVTFKKLIDDFKSV